MPPLLYGKFSVGDAGLSQQDTSSMKLAATRATVARLEAISAVYDSQLLSSNDDDVNSDNAALMLRLKRTVSVKEFQREGDK